MSLCISLFYDIHDELLVLIYSFYDEFILHSRTNVPKGESIVKPQKVSFQKNAILDPFECPKVPLRIDGLINLLSLFYLANPRPEYRSARKIEGGSGPGIFFGPLDQKL